MAAAIVSAAAAARNFSREVLIIGGTRLMLLRGYFEGLTGWCLEVRCWIVVAARIRCGTGVSVGCLRGRVRYRGGEGCRVAGIEGYWRLVG